MRPTLMLLLALTVIFAGQSVAQSNYPSKPIRLVVGFPPGGSNDVIARVLGAKLQEVWGQSAVVDNKPGANSIIATEFVAKAPHDGYTLLINASGMVVNPAMYASLPYDVLRDFEPISMLVAYPFVLVIHPLVPAQSVNDLIQVAKSNPGKLNYSAASTAFQLAAELFKQQAGVDINRIPYKGSAQAINAVLANDVQLTFIDSLPVVPLIQSGRLRGLAVTSPTRSSSLPDLPTMTQAGMPEVEIVGWTSLFAPAGTPRPIVTSLHQQVARIMQLPDIRARMTALGGEPVGGTPEELAAIMKKQISKWIAVARAANIKAE